MTWKKKWGNNHLCPILQSRLRPGKDKNGVSYTVTLKCKHRFYRKALYKWYDTKPYCPVCRSNIQF